MRQLRQQMKRNAKWALHKSWGKAIAIILIGVAISLLFTILETIVTLVLDIPTFLDVADTLTNFIDDIPNTTYLSLGVTMVIALLSFFVMSPLELGIKQWFYGVSDGKSEDIASIFSFFDSAKLFFKSLWLNICIFFKMFFYGIVMFALNIVLTIAIIIVSQGAPSRLQMVIVSGGIILDILLFFCALIFLKIFSFRYFLAPYLIFENRDLSVREAIKGSVQETKGHKQNLFTFWLSFLGWYALSIFIFPALYVYPYTRTSFSIYARYIIAQQDFSPSTIKAEATREFSASQELDADTETVE